MIRVFRDDEHGYESWLREHPHGLVFNHFGGSDASYNKIHFAHCIFLHRAQDIGARTTVEKVCCDTAEELTQEVARLRGASWAACKVCIGEV